MFFLLRSKRWVINLRREDLMKYSTEQLYAQYTVCANHFEDSQFMNPAQKNRLIYNAVPTLIAQHNAPPKLTPKGHHLNKDVNQFQHHHHQHHHQFVMKASQQRQKQINPKLQTVSKCHIPQV